MFWGGSRSTKPCVFPCKVAAGDDERYLVCATGAAGVGWCFFLPQCNGGLKLLWVCFCVRSHRVFWHLRLQNALEWLYDVAWAMFWGGSRSTKPCVFPCKMAAGDDERYLVCATGAAGVGWSFFFCRSVTVAWSCFGCACVCVVIVCFGISGCRSHWNGCMMLHGLCFGEEAGARNRGFFRVKWLQATMKGTSCVRRVRLGSVWSVKCGLGRVQCEVRSVKCWLRRVRCEVWRLSSVKCDVGLQVWHVKHDISFAECTHARAWLAHGACKFYRSERSHIYL